MQTQTDASERREEEPQLGNYACCHKPIKVGYRHCTVCHMNWSIDGIHTCCPFTVDDYAKLYNAAKDVTDSFGHNFEPHEETMLFLMDLLEKLPKP